MSDERMTPSHDCGGDAAAYVLGSLTPEETEAFRAHMEECVVCRDEVHALQGVADALPMAAPQYPVPRELRKRVLRQVHEEARERAGAAGKRSPGRARRPARGWVGVPRLVLALGVGVALAAAVVIGIVVGSSGSSCSTHAASVGQAQLQVCSGRGLLAVNRLPQPRAGHIYQVWVEHGSAPPSPTKALFGVTANGSADVGVPGDLSGVSAVLVTQEPDGGTLHPTSPPVIVTPLA
jgi:anti-sigma factor RsiW